MSADAVTNSNKPCLRPEVAMACQITMLVAFVALTIIALVCQAHPGTAAADFFAKHQTILLSVAVAGCGITFALRLFALCRKEDLVVPVRTLNVDPDVPARAIVAEEPVQEIPIPPPPRVKKLRAVHVIPPPNLIVQQEKAKLRKEAAARIAEAGKHCKRVDWQQFALMNNTTLIRGSLYDKGLTGASAIQAHLDYLHLLETGGLIFPMERGVLPGVVATLTDAQEILRSQNAPMLWAWLQNVPNLINAQLDTKGYVYFHSGYSGPQNKSGHGIIGKLKKEKGKVTFYFLNLGEGIQHSEYQPQLNGTETQSKISRCTYPSQVSIEEWNHVGESFITHLMRFHNDIPDKKHPYSTYELYQLQNALAPPNPDLLLPFVAQMEGKPQYLGDCSDKAWRNLIIDFLAVEKRLSEEQIAVFFLNLHLASLLAAFHSYQSHPNPHHKELLIDGIEQCANYLLRSKSQLAEHDYLVGGEIFDMMLNGVKTPSALPYAPIAANHIPEPITVFPLIVGPRTSHADFRMPQPELKSQKDVKGRIAFPTQFSHPFNPLQFKQDLKPFLVHSYHPPLIIRYISSLPVPQWDIPEDPWNHVPLTDIPGILHDLTKLYDNIWHSTYLEGEAVLCVLTLYTIADKLARRNNTLTKLKGFASPFDVDKTEGCLTFRSGLQEKRFNQIKHYHANSHQAAGGKVLCPVTTHLQFIKYRAKRALGEQSPETRVLDYLDQFPCSPLTTYASLWENLPSEIHSLYFFANAADLLGNGRLQTLHDEEAYILCRAPLIYQHHWDGSLEIARTTSTWAFNHDSLELQDQFLTYRKGSTNEILCNSTHSFAKLKRGLVAYHGKPTSPEMTNDLTLLHQHPVLKIGLAIPWIRTHRPDLNHKLVQESIENCFFSPGVLREYLTDRPERVNEVRELIEESLNEYRNQHEHIRAILFLIRFTITFEDFVSVIFDKPIDQKTLGMCEKHLSVLLSQLKWGHKADQRMYRDAQAHYLYLCLSMQTEITEKLLIELYTHLCLFSAADGDWYGHWFYLWHGSLALARLDQFLDQFHQFLSSQGDRAQLILNTICNQILASLLGDNYVEDSDNWHWISPSTCHSDHYVIHFSTGSIYLRSCGGELAFISSWQRQWFDTSDYHLEPGSLWWKVRSAWHSMKWAYLPLDQKMLIYKEERDETTQLFTVGREKTADYYNVGTSLHFQKEDYQTLHFLHLLPLLHDEISPNTVHSSHKHTGKPFVRIDFDTEGTIVTRLDDDGHPLPYKLANLMELDPRHPIYAYTLQIAPHDELLCFINETTGEIAELHFPRLNLIFTNKGGALVDGAGFSFTKMPIKTLGSLSPHAIVLRNDNGKIKLILPATKAKLPLGKKKKEREFLFKKYCVYDLKSPQHEIRFTSPSDHLFFVYFFKAHGKLTRAYQELKKIRHFAFDSKIFDIFYQFFSIPDHSPSSLAFNLRLILLIVDHFHLLDALAIKRARNFLERRLHWYVHYLRCSETDRCNAIPCEWRLSEEEESRILTALLREGIQLPKVLQIREEMLHTEERSAIIELDPQNGPPSAFCDVLPPHQLGSLLDKSTDLGWKRKSLTLSISHPNRVPESYACHHFFTLFAQAKQARPGHADPFDFTLLTLLKHEKKELPSLLFYVRHFPQHFKGIDFPLMQDPKPIFNNLVHLAMQLETTPELHTFQQKVLNHVTQFDYKKTTILTLPSKSAPPQSLPPIDPWDIDENPLMDLCETLFEKQEGASFEGLTLFEDSLLSENTLMQELLESYQTAYTKLCHAENHSYLLKSNKLDSVAIQLKKRHQDYLSELESSENKILQYVNDPFGSFQSDFTTAQEVEFRLHLNAHQFYAITPEMVMKEAILKNSTALFDQHRPMLQSKHIQAIIEEVHYYYHLQVLASMCSDALGHLAALKENPDQPLIQKELFAILNYTFLYVPEDYPEIGFMKIKTGKMPRPEQVMVYTWVCEGLDRHENRLFQLPAGGGKTSYLIPLMTLRCKKLKLMPVVVTTDAMYPTEIENLGATLSLLDENLDTLNTAASPQITHQNLEKNLSKGNALIVTPKKLYDLKLKFFTASVDNPEAEQTRLLGAILNLFKQRTLLLGDESHRTFNPLTQAISGVGSFVHLEQDELSLLFQLMKALLTMPQVGDVDKIKQALASQFSDQSEMIAFLTTKKVAEPACMADLDPSQRHLALMTRYFLNALLPKILKMQTDFDHVYSQEQGEIDTPAYHKTPSHAQFKDPYLTFALTVKGIWHRGLNVDQLRALIQKLKTMDRDEQFLVAGGISTPSQKRFHGWVHSQFPDLALRDVDLENCATLGTLLTHVKKKLEVLEYYLFLMVHPRIGYAAEQFTSTPAHLMEIGKSSVIFSATPLTRIAYPQSLQEARYGPLFEVKVIAQAAKEKNQNFIFPKGVTDFFAKLETTKEQFSHVRYMIDAGGFLCHEENEAIARRWLEVSTLEGVIYFKEGESLALLLRNGKKIEFQGTNDLKTTLAAYGISWDTQAIGVFLDAPHAESANFPPIPHSAAYILSGGSVTLPHAIQSIMRERAFLDEAIDQRLIWVIPSDLMTQHGASEEGFHSSTLFSWFLQQEVKAYKSTILMAAFQEIAFKIEHVGLSLADKRPQYIHAHATAFKEQARPTQAWNSDEKSENTGAFLRQFATDYYARFQYATPYAAQGVLKGEIEALITQVEKKIAHIKVNFHASTATEVHQKCMLHVQEEIEKVNYNPSPVPVTPEPVMPHTPLTDPDYPLSLDPQHEVCAVFKTPHLTPHFYLEPNQLHTARRLDQSLKEKFLKPIDFILIVTYRDQVYAQALSHDVAIHHLKSLKNPPQNVHVEHKAFMIRSDGVLYQDGKGVLAPSLEKRDEILHSTWLQDVLIDTALLRGEILNDNERFSQRVTQWPHFPAFWKKILKALPFPRVYSPHALLSFVPSKDKKLILNKLQGGQL